MNWVKVCSYDDLVPQAGVAAMIGEAQIAIFFEEEKNNLFAVSNWDPIGKANVLSRGLVVDVEGKLTVASPLYKQRYDLETGNCLDDDICLPTWGVKLENNSVWVALK